MDSTTAITTRRINDIPQGALVTVTGRHEGCVYIHHGASTMVLVEAAAVQPLAPRLTVAEAVDIRSRGGQVKMSAAGDVVITYPRWAVDARTLEVLAERTIG